MLRGAPAAGKQGHKEIGDDFFKHIAAQPNLVHVVLEDLGICQVDVAARLVDAPGVVTDSRAPERYLRLVSAACGVLGPGEATLESWGDTAEVLTAYETFGFAIVERLDGWSLDL